MSPSDGMQHAAVPSVWCVSNWIVDVGEDDERTTTRLILEVSCYTPVGVVACCRIDYLCMEQQRNRSGQDQS